MESSTEDLVYLTSGEILPGTVKVNPDTGKIHLTRKTKSGKGEVVLDPTEVLRIHYADQSKNRSLLKKNEPKFPEIDPEIAIVVEALLEDLAGDNADKVVFAEEKLADMGIFAESSITKALENSTGAYRTRLLRLDKLTKLKKAIAPIIVTGFPDVYECMTTTNVEPKLEMIRLILMMYPDDAPSILVHIALDTVSENEFVRRYCVKQLNVLNRPHELITVLEKADPPLAMVAAIYLGERGVLVGIPILINALESKSEKVRAIALDKLRTFTRQDFGGTAYDPLEEREQYIRRWRNWLKENTKRISRQASAVRMDDVPEKDQQQSDFLYRQAQIAYEHGNVSEALYLFEETLRYNPANVAAHMNIAILMYEELHDLTGAKERLLKLQSFYVDRISSQNLRDIFLHLGIIALREKEWSEAQKRFTQCTTQDQQFIKGYVALAKSYKAQLDLDNNLIPGPRDGEDSLEILKAKREMLLSQALESYKSAEELISGTRAALEDEDYVSGWRNAVEDLGNKGNRPGVTANMKNPVPDDLIAVQRLMLNKRHTDILKEIARIYYQQDKVFKAVRIMETACQIRSEDVDLLYGTAMLYEVAGNTIDAKKTYEKIIDIDPEHEGANQNLKMLKKLEGEEDENEVEDE